MILQIFFGYNRTWSVAIFTVALFLNGAVTAGYLGNGLDIAPNFSGTIFGLANTLSSFGGFLSTYMVGALTYNNVSLI
jgi:MFS transporter, ACS family, solute carrier family 17 (sodium-dependent inorganic phosphate cotransporter), other